MPGERAELAADHARAALEATLPVDNNLAGFVEVVEVGRAYGHAHALCAKGRTDALVDGDVRLFVELEEVVGKLAVDFHVLSSNLAE
jgi:hypothetical protein